MDIIPGNYFWIKDSVKSNYAFIGRDVPIAVKLSPNILILFQNSAITMKITSVGQDNIIWKVYLREGL